MDCNRLALFLAGYTTLGFRQSLHNSPHATLIKCGFNPGEAALLAVSVTKHTAGSSAKHETSADTHELERIRLTFQQISRSFSDGGKTASDDWDTRC